MWISPRQMRDSRELTRSGQPEVIYMDLGPYPGSCTYHLIWGHHFAALSLSLFLCKMGQITISKGYCEV